MQVAKNTKKILEIKDYKKVNLFQSESYIMAREISSKRYLLITPSKVEVINKCGSIEYYTRAAKECKAYFLIPDLDKFLEIRKKDLEKVKEKKEKRNIRVKKKIEKEIEQIQQRAYRLEKIELKKNLMEDKIIQNAKKYERKFPTLSFDEILKSLISHEENKKRKTKISNEILEIMKNIKNFHQKSSNSVSEALRTAFDGGGFREPKYSRYLL